jgi:hypothetical protein
LLECTGAAGALVAGLAGVAEPRQAPSQRRRPGQSVRAPVRRTPSCPRPSAASRSGWLRPL